MIKIQKNIYKIIKIKEINSTTNTVAKQKYIKLETNKTVPPGHLINS